MIYNLTIDLIVNGIMLTAGVLILKAMIRKWENWIRLCIADRLEALALAAETVPEGQEPACPFPLYCETHSVSRCGLYQ